MSGSMWHEPVLLKEVMDFLAPAPGQILVDATLGLGSHSLAILDKLGGEGLLIGIDRDPQMLAAARSRIEAAGHPSSCYRLVEADHAQLPSVLAETLAAPFPTIDGLMFDLGPSTPQLLDPARGMSWESDAALDMRLTPGAPGPTAAEIVNDRPARELERIFRENAGERWARRIAERIARERLRAPITTGRRLGQIIGEAIPRRFWPPRTHPATRCFLALRVEVNREYETLERALPAAFERLKPGGRLVVISFHSGEDRRVKEFMRRMTTAPATPWPLPQGAAPPVARLLTRRPVTPGPDEVRRNPRSRSARLRAMQKLEA